MNSVLLVVVVALLLISATSASLVASPQRVEDISCGECRDIVSIVYGIDGNKIALNTTVEVLLDICNVKFVNDTIRKDECVILVKLAGLLVPLLFDGMNSLAWDIPLTFCADVAKVCKEPCCVAGAPPQEIFISFADSTDLTQMRATWITLNETVGAGVQWWVQGSNVVSVARETPRTYTAGGWIGVIHSAVMTNLIPNSLYVYRVGGDVTGWSQNITFQTLPSVIGVPSRPLRVLQLADMGYAKFSNATTEMIAQYVNAGKVDMIIHNGDIGYADADEQHWDLFFTKLQPSFSKVAYMTSPGNHELYWNFTAYRARLGMSMPPTVPAAGSGAMYYTLQVGPVPFVFLDSESWIDTGNIDPMQLQWFQTYMNTLNRTATPVVTVAQHRPLYCCECGDILSAILREESEQSIVNHHIDLHLSGHQHNYQRLYPLINGTLVSTNYTNPNAPVYVVNGAAGNREGQMGFHKSAPYYGSGSSEYGFSYIVYSVDDATRTATVNFEFIESETGVVGDSFTLVKTF
jgi:acid phosphatase type 7